MLLKAQAYKNDVIENAFQKALEKSSDFFEIEKHEKPLLLFLENRKAINIYLGIETENWVVGNFQDNTIMMLAPENYETESIHKYSESKYIQTINHEVCHFFQNLITSSYKPLWFSEGLATYISEQYKDFDIPAEFKSFLNYHENGGKDLYFESGYAVFLLLKEHGKEKILKFIKEFQKDNSEEFTKETFQKHFNSELKYSYFNELLHKHLHKK